jgi:YebC/PmpR family DNA-binding regulatory protein
MAGHSKWAQIKRQKSMMDVRRGQLFTKLGREITVAARQGVPDPEVNVRLRLAIQRAREHNMPQETIERAIKRAIGATEEGGHLEEIMYEGYGPGGAAILVEAMTDNRNRTAAEVRNVFNRHGGTLGEAGSVAWMFKQRGLITIPLNGGNAEEITLQAIDAGADDVQEDDGVLEVYTEPAALDEVRRALEQQGVKISSAELTYVPISTITLDDTKALQVMRLIERLEELDDVQKVHTNLEITEQLVEQVAS